jgi:hypothetical protein
MKYKDWSTFKVSCTAISSVMSKPVNCRDLTPKQVITMSKILCKDENERTDNDKRTFEILLAKSQRFLDPPLSESAKKYLLTRYSWEKYNKGTLSSNSEKRASLVKGNELETDAFKIVSLRDKIEYTSGDKFIYNDYIFGRCDIFSKENNRIVDTKISWGIHTYLPNHTTKLSAKHWFQMQGYMALYGISQAEVCYVLLNTPPHLLERERNRYTEKYLLGEIDSDNYEEAMEKCDLCYDYSKIPKKRKIITFIVKHEPEVLNMIYRKVIKCRDWLTEFDKIHTNNKKIVTSSDDYMKVAQEYDEEYNT